MANEKRLTRGGKSGVAVGIASIDVNANLEANGGKLELRGKITFARMGDGTTATVSPGKITVTGRGDNVIAEVGPGARIAMVDNTGHKTKLTSSTGFRLLLRAEKQERRKPGIVPVPLG